ncbi:MAG: amidohydrolase family protein [Chitinophagaceae bacterium]
MKQTSITLLILFCVTCSGICFAQKKSIDLLIYNARIYTVDARFSKATCLAVHKGRIEAVGDKKALLSTYTSVNQTDANGKFVYPGFIDAHAHFYGYGLSLRTANLVGTSSWEEILSRLLVFSKQNRDGWLTGRGWDQNDWEVKEFPDKEGLDQLFPDRPVLLTRVDGHAAIANQQALDMAGLQAGHTLTGGQVETRNGKLTGILVDNAIRLVSAKIPAPTSDQQKQALLEAQQNCFAAGLTTVNDCGLDYKEVLFIDSLQKAGLLKMRVYAMLSDVTHNYNFLFKTGRIKTDHLNVRSFKVYADGALGSRGAALLQPYSDKPGWSGFLLRTPKHYDSVARLIAQHDFQMCTHAIGDSANRSILNIYGKYLKGKNDKRWRIEHAQVVNSADLNMFGKFSVTPSVQPTHATSDMYWAGERLGLQRVQGAYAFKQLLNQNGWMPLGTDFPVEDISPFKTFYAAVFRIDAKANPHGGFQMENALTRQQALKGMTIWAARSNFEEKEKGSLEKGKMADFVIVDKDLLSAPASEVLKTTVLATYLGGEKVWGK